MRRRSRRALHILFLLAGISIPAAAQGPPSWEQVLQRFQQNNPALLAGQTNVGGTRANEITADLKPNPQLSFTSDQCNLFRTNPYRPFAASQLASSSAGSDQADAQRQLVFALRDAFVRLLQAKSVLELAQDNLKYYEQVIVVNRRRLEAGDLARADFDRIALQRAQYESDLENAKLNLCTAKITLLSMMNDKHSVDEFDVSGTFDFNETVLLPEELHKMAVDARGDIRSVSYAYSRGSASLLDFLDAQKSYRDTELSYRNLIGSYLSAVNQLKLAVGREVL
jgi:cobalt-zinc-cadmium efflux system outer membrane protein